MSGRVTQHLAIRGRVQGVGFRYSMVEEARSLGVAGWVRNRRDGSVEAVIQGGEAAVAALRQWTERGPRGAEVSEVVATPADGEFSAFELRPTA